MALNKKENNSISIGLLIIATLTVPLISTQNIDCKGKAFHCINSTHFKICVDLGGGISTTVDDFLIPCPRDTVCKDNNFFECEYQATTTLTPTEQSDVPNDKASVPIWDNFDIPTLSTSATSEVDLSRDHGTTFAPDLNSPILTIETVKYSLTSTSLDSANEYNNTNSDISVSAKYNIYQTTASEAVTNIDGFSTKVPKVILNKTISDNAFSTNNISTTTRTTESIAQIEPNSSTSKTFLQTQDTTIIYSNDSFSIPITTNSNYINNESSTETISTKNLLVTLFNESIVTKHNDAKTTTDAISNSPTLHSLTDKVSTTQYENVTSPDGNLKSGSITDDLDKVSTNPVLATNVLLMHHLNEPLSTTEINNNELHIEKNNLNPDFNMYNTSVSIHLQNNSTTENIVIESNVPNIFQSNNEQLIKDNVTEILNISKTTIFDNLGELNTMSTVTYKPVQDMTIDKYILPTPTVSNLNMSVEESYTHIANSVKNSFDTSSPFDNTNTEPLQKEYINYITDVIKIDTAAKSSDIKPTITINSTQPNKIYNSLNSTELINESISKEPLTNFKNSYISHLKKIESESTVANYVLNSNNNNNSDIPFTQHLTDINLSTQSTITYKTDSNINYEFSIASAMDAVKEQPTSYTDIHQDKITTPIVTFSHLNSQKLSPTTNNDGTLSKSEVILSGIDSTTISSERDTSTTISSKNTITVENILDNKDNLPYKSVDNINLTKYSGSEINILPPISVNTTTINKGDSITKDSSAPKNLTVNQEENNTLVNINSPYLNLNEMYTSTNRNILATSISDNERTKTLLATTNAQNVTLNDIYDSNKMDLNTSNAVFNYSTKIEETSASTDVQNVSLNETYLSNNSNKNNEATSTYNDIIEAILTTNNRQNLLLDVKNSDSYTTGIGYIEITEATSTTIGPQKVTLDKMTSSNNIYKNILTTSTAGLIYNELTETTTSKIDANTVFTLNSAKVITSEDKKIGQESYIPQVANSSFIMSTGNFKNVSSNYNKTDLKKNKKVMSFNNNETSIIDDRENKQAVFTTETVNLNSNYIENVFNEDLTSNPKELISNSYVPNINNNIKESNNHSLKNSTVNLSSGYSLQNLSKDDHFTTINNIPNFDILTITEPVMLENKKVNDPLNTDYINLLSTTTPKNIYLNKSQIINSTQVKDTEFRRSNTNSSIINSLSGETKNFNISSAGKTFISSLYNLETTTVSYISNELETSFKREGYVEQNLLNTLNYSEDHVNVKTNVLPYSEIELKNIKNAKDSSISNNLESFTQGTEILSSALFTSPKPNPVQKIENRKVTQNTLDNTANSFSKDFSIQRNHTKNSLNITEENNKNKLLTNNLATIKYEASSRPTISKNNILLKFNGNNKSKDDFIAFTLQDRILNNTLIESGVNNKTAVYDKSSTSSYNEINNIKPLTTSTRKSISSGTSHYIMHPKAVMSATQFKCTKRGKYSDKNDCNKFYICIGKSDPIVGICPHNTVFSEIRKQCTRNLAHCIRNNQFRCLAPGRFIDVLTNKFYYICVKKIDGYVRFKLICKDGYYLNTANIQCLPYSVEDISVSEKSTQDTISTESKHSKQKEYFICKEEGKFVYSNDCKKYYVCKKNSKSQFRRKLKECDSDEVFDKDTRKCVENDSYEC